MHLAAGRKSPQFLPDVFFLSVLQSFERVLVENKLHGLSPELSEAIQSISRWELVQAALPHVLHCTSILLSNRNKLGKGEGGWGAPTQGSCHSSSIGATLT